MKDRQQARNAAQRAERDAALCARQTQAWDTERDAARFCVVLKREHDADWYPFECRACGKWHLSALSPEEWRSRLAKADPRREARA